jgi:antitoxin CcdA
MGKVELDIGIDSELLAQAKRLGISVAGMSETQLRLHLQKIDPAGAEERARRWAEENAEAIRAYNERIARREVRPDLADHFRKW